jgi:hypothetical protein
MFFWLMEIKWACKGLIGKAKKIRQIYAHTL